MMEPNDRPLRRPTPPAAASSPLPAAPSPWLPLPSALVPPKKRRVLQTPRKAATPIPPPPPLRALAASPAAAAGAGADALVMPAPPPPPPADAAAPPPSGEKPPSPLAEIPSSPPPPPGADEKPSTPLPTDAAAKPATPTKARNHSRRVVPEGAIAASNASAGALCPGGERSVKESPGDQNAVSDELVGEVQSLVEIAVEKTVAGVSAVAACEALLGNKRASGGILGAKPEDCDAPDLGEPVSMVEEGGEAGMSDRMTEVFVGALDRDAKEEDVRVALAGAGEITEVRMPMDAKAKKNKGFCFVRYREVAQARKAIEEFGHVKVVLDSLE